ncbi:hypothetical protein CMV_020766 [Castanea mollissima]|uniref:Uncharacterized protein n=1 Tax=Castanea mollissima TaxID=60419 RepID=A0A8J4V9X5_9ROSI|nr:hypothetical protein CMV_020766 [Castanea mollissima]
MVVVISTRSFSGKRFRDDVVDGRASSMKNGCCNPNGFTFLTIPGRNLRLISVKRVPVGAMPESFGGEYCLFGDRLWDDHIAVLLIHELGHLIRKPQKGICILTPTVALVQQIHSTW